MAKTDYLDTVQKIYIGYYQRAADPGGQIYWAERLDASGGNLNKIIEAFANSAESQALYGTITRSNIGDVVDDIYNAQFGRDAEAGGKAFYVDGFNAGTFTAATIMLNVLNGAQGEDLLSVNNKVTASNLFTETIDPELDGRDYQATYSGDADAGKGRDFLSTVGLNPVTIPTQAETTAYIKEKIADTGDPILVTAGQTFTLTTGADNFVGGSGNDTFNGLYTNGYIGTGNTFNGLAGNDVLTAGGGTDTLNISPVLAGTAITLADVDFAGVSGMENLVFADTTGGAQSFTLGTNVNAGFAAGMNLTATSTGGGTTLVMSDTTIAETVIIDSTGGANTITTGSGLTSLDVASTGGKITVTSGAVSVTANTITTDSTDGVQAITTSNGNQIIDATATIGGITVTTGTGTDSIAVNAAAGVPTITAGTGADAITLGTHAAIATINQADGDSIVMTAETTTGLIAAGQTITFGNSLDRITGFAGATDVLNVGTAGAALSGIGMNEAAFTGAATIFLSGAYAAGVFTIAADGAGADTLLLDTTVVADQNIATADTWVVLVGTNSASLVAGSFA